MHDLQAMRARAILVAISAAGAVALAAPSPPAPPGAKPKAPADFEHDMMVRYHMHGNLDLLRAIDRLLLRGRLEDARALAQSIAQGDLTRKPLDLRGFMRSLESIFGSPD